MIDRRLEAAAGVRVHPTASIVIVASASSPEKVQVRNISELPSADGGIELDQTKVAAERRGEQRRPPLMDWSRLPLARSASPRKSSALAAAVVMTTADTSTIAPLALA